MKKISLLITLTILISLFKVSSVQAQTPCPTLPTNTGTIILSTTTTAGTYRVWSRMRSADANNNSFYLKIDNNCPILVGDSSLISNTTWTWVDYQNGNLSSKIDATLTAGDHVITLIGNEPGVIIDKVLMTKNLSCVPVDFGTNCSSELPTNTPTPTPAPTSTPIPTSTPLPTYTPTPTPKPTSTPTPVPPTPTNIPLSQGDGLLGMYYPNRNLTNVPVYRIDPVINFDWGKNSPTSGVSLNNFSVRWSGHILPKTSETYTIYARSDDGIRVWVNNQLIIDQWNDHSATEYAGSIYLNANQKYQIKIEYYEKNAFATARLSWSTPSISKAVVPQSQLYTYK